MFILHTSYTHHIYTIVHISETLAFQTHSIYSPACHLTYVQSSSPICQTVCLWHLLVYVSSSWVPSTNFATFQQNIGSKLCVFGRICCNKINRINTETMWQLLFFKPRIFEWYKLFFMTHELAHTVEFSFEKKSVGAWWMDIEIKISNGYLLTWPSL